MKLLIHLYFMWLWCTCLRCLTHALRNDSVDETDDDESRLLRKLFKNYDPEIRPVLKISDAVTVRIGISLFQLIQVDFKNQIIKCNTWTRQSWRDPLLSWNHSEFGGIKTVNVRRYKVWKPDVYLYNNVDDTSDGAMDRFDTQIVISQQGHVMWLAPKIIISNCKFDVSNFPFDEQFCELKFGSWTYDGFRLDLVPEKGHADLKKFIRNGEWDLVGMPAKRTEGYYECCPEPYPDVTYTIHLRRKSMFYFVNLIGPCCMISALTLLSFYLPPDSGERLTLVITNLLALTVFMLLVTEIIPATSEVVPIISVYFYGSMFQIALALVGTCFVLKCHFSNPCHTPIPSWIRLVILNWMARLLKIPVKYQQDVKEIEPKSLLCTSDKTCTKCNRNSSIYNSGVVYRKMENVIAEGTKEKLEETAQAHFVRPSSAHLSLRPQGTHSENRLSAPPILNVLLSPSDAFASPNTPHGNRGNKETCGKVVASDINDYHRPNSDIGILSSEFERMQLETQQGVQELVRFAHEREKGEQLKQEWTLVAHIVDQFLIWVFLVILAIFTVTLFMHAPRYTFE